MNIVEKHILKIKLAREIFESNLEKNVDEKQARLIALTNYVGEATDNSSDVLEVLLAHPQIIKPLFIAIFGGGCCAGRLAMASEIQRVVKLKYKQENL
jgi:hypothetical protein